MLLSVVWDMEVLRLSTRVRLVHTAAAPVSGNPSTVLCLQVTTAAALCFRKVALVEDFEDIATHAIEDLRKQKVVLCRGERETLWREGF